MGVYDRDYYRENPRGFFDTWGPHSATIWLILITCFAFLAQIVARDMNGGGFGIPASYYGSIRNKGEFWQLITPIFLYPRDHLWILVINMFILYWAGSRMEEDLGRWEFVLFYVTAGIAANVGCFLLQLAELVPQSQPLLSSGAVTAVFILFAFHYPYQQILLFFVLPMPVWAVACGFVVLDSLATLNSNGGGLSFIAHLLGALFGTIYYQSGARFFGFVPKLPARRAAPKLRVLPQSENNMQEEPVGAALEFHGLSADSSDEPFEAKVDRVLDKVSKHGQGSLTSEEREILFRASDVYKKRRK